MLWTVVWIPALAGIMAMILPGQSARRALLVTGSMAHIAMVAWLCASGTNRGTGLWVGLDGPGQLFLCVTSGLFLAVAIYAVGYLRRESAHATCKSEDGFAFCNEPEAIFIGCMLFFLATMSLVCLSQHLGLLWVAVEATTLVSAPLISFHRHHYSLEATWKYLLICSVGIALALLGNFFIAFAARGHIDHLTMSELLASAAAFDPAWLKAAFIMMLVGYGTKMGLAPMHTWLPDAHSEAPSMVSALLSGALLNCAFLGILRGHTILAKAGLGDFSGELLILFGLLSMSVAAIFLIRQADFKRMLAYSSVEHMGILALGVGLGGLASSGAMFHAVNHSLTKGMLFLLAGNLMDAYKTKRIERVRGALRVTPVTGGLWLAGFFAITGAPPFGAFMSEWIILKGALDAGRWAVAAGYLFALAVIFIAMAKIFLPMVFGSPQENAAPLESPRPEPLWSVAPALVMGAIVVVLGLYVPPAVWNLFQQAAFTVGGR